MLLCVHTCVVTLETPLSGVAQANRLRPHTTQQEDRRTGTLLHGCHLQIKKLYKVKTIMEPDVGDAAGPSRP